MADPGNMEWTQVTLDPFCPTEMTSNFLEINHGGVGGGVCVGVFLSGGGEAFLGSRELNGEFFFTNP